MEMSIWIARFLGPVLLATAVPMIITPKVIGELAGDFLESRSLIYVSGVLVFVGGLSIVNTHNRWNMDWTVLITLFGWAMVICGASRIVAPRVVVKVGQAMTDRSIATRISAAAWAAIGALFTIKGYA